MAQLVIAKRVKNAILYTCGHIRIDNVRLSYPHLAKAWSGEESGDPKFSLVGLLPKKTHREAIELVKGQIDALKKANKNAKVPADKLFLKDGDVYFQEKEECEGMYCVSASEGKRPVCRHADGEVMEISDISEIMYGGCYVDILINPWYQDNKYGKRVNANLRSVRFRKDGDPFGEGRVDDESAWGDGDFDDDDEV